MRNIKKTNLVAYSDKQYYKKNDKIKIYLNYNKSNQEKYLYFKIYTIKKVLIVEKQYSINIKYIEEKSVETLQFAEGCNFESSIELNLKNINVINDLFIIELIYNNSKFYLPLIITNNYEINENNKKENLVLLNTNTWQAYNPYSDIHNSLTTSFYYCCYNNMPCKPKKKSQFKNKYISSSFESTILSFNRPNFILNNDLDFYINNFDLEKKTIYNSVDIFSEILFLLFLKKHNIDYQLITDFEIDNIFKTKHNIYNYLLNQYKIFFIQSHPEYWTYGNLKFANNFLKTKSNCLINLGGNVCFNKVCINHKTNQIECHKDNKEYQFKTEKEKITKVCNWRNDKIEKYGLKRPQKLFLNHYSYNSGNNKYYTIINPDHKIFNNINITKNTIGHNNLIGKNGTCGWEMDSDICKKFQKYILAKRTDIRKKLGGEMILYDETKNKVFSCGSMVFCGSLLVDKDIEQLVLNIYGYFKK